jgi:hypothetical protein
LVHVEVETFAVEREVTGNAEGDVRDALEYRHATDGAADLNADREALRERVSGADIWCVQQYHGQVRWIAQVEADSPRHLLEGLRDAGRDAETAL